MDVLELEGKEFVKASVAAKEVGYTTDYVGQLSRAGKIHAKQVGRVWYVSKDDLYAYKQANPRSNKAKTLASIKVQRGDEKPDVEQVAVQVSPHVLGRPDSKFKERLLATQVSYERDADPLIPKLEKKVPVTEEKAPKPVHLTVVSEEEEQKPKQELEIEDEIKQDYEFEPKRAFEQVPMEGEISVSSLDDAPDDESEEIDEKLVEANFKDKINAGDSISIPVASIDDRISTVPIHTAGILAAALFLLAITAVAAGIFLQNIWVYESNSHSVTSLPSYETSYGVTGISTIYQAISR